jgi:arginine decarboxylase-like protein
MPKKKVTDKLLKSYLTYMDYFATGEGRTVELNLCFVDTVKEAREKHLDMFVGDRKEARDYFGAGVVVMPIKSKQAKELISNIFKFGKGLHQNLFEAGVEFHLKVYFNYN